MELPFCECPKKLIAEINLCRKQDRDDAIQEAWANPDDPIQAVKRFQKRQYRFNKRHSQIEHSADGDIVAMRKNGTIVGEQYFRPTAA